MKKLFLTSIFFITVNITFAVEIIFSAIDTNGVGDSFGNDLVSGSLVEVGIWDEGDEVFIPLDSYNQDTGFNGTTFIDNAFPGSFQGKTDNIDTTIATGLGLADSQLAIRWSNQTDNSFGIVYSKTDDWKLLNDNGSQPIPATNAIDLADLTDNSGFNLLDSAVIVAGKFEGESVTFEGTPLFQTPEPSTYAVIFGFFTLTFVVIRNSMNKKAHSAN